MNGKHAVVHAHHVANLSSVELLIRVVAVCSGSAYAARNLQLVEVENVDAVACAYVCLVLVHSEEAAAVGNA